MASLHHRCDTDVYGNIAVAECLTEENVSLSADVAIIALGWETRCTALEVHVSLSVKQVLVLDFALADSGEAAIEESRRKLREFSARSGAELTELVLHSSVDYQRNMNTLQIALAELGRKLGSYHGTLRRVFVDCSTMPRIYIQWLVAHGLGSGAIHAIDFGYAEGSYQTRDDPAEFSSQVNRYETVPLLEGSGGMGEEKLLLVAEATPTCFTASSTSSVPNESPFSCRAATSTLKSIICSIRR
ncbi:MAG: hypothetical protein E5V70_00310 [Mesorhizobium sp.]|nr:MAG: hypothetical protein E5V70_00310 [Mesorhizobium sp.]